MSHGEFLRRQLPQRVGENNPILVMGLVINLCLIKKRRRGTQIISK